MKNTTLFIDFDSTFSQAEAFDILVEISIQDEKQRKKAYKRIKELNDLSMSGLIEIQEALEEQVKLIEATKNDINRLSEQLKTMVSKSILANQEFLVTNKEHIHIISNGFEDFIKPVIEWFGLNSNQVYANRFIYNENNQIINLDKETPLSRPAGKPIIIKELNLKTRIIMLGDGFNDYQVKKAGVSDLFLLFTENIRRERVVPFADKIIHSFDDVIPLL